MSRYSSNNNCNNKDGLRQTFSPSINTGKTLIQAIALREGKNMAVGKRNFTKAKTLIYLYERYEGVVSGKPQVYGWQSVSDLAFWCRVPSESLRVLLKRWEAWQLVESHFFSNTVTSDRRRHIFYRLGQRGLSYVKSMPKWYENLQEAKGVLREQKSFVNEDAAMDPPNIEITSVPFTTGVPASRMTVWGVRLHWPFQLPQDAQKDLLIGQYKVKLEVALGAVSDLYGVRVSDRCREQAIAIWRSIAHDAGYELTGR